MVDNFIPDSQPESKSLQTIIYRFALKLFTPIPGFVTKHAEAPVISPSKINFLAQPVNNVSNMIIWIV